MKFKIGDKLKASEYDREQYGLKYVTITSINEEKRVYHWEAKCDWGKVHSGYFFHEAVPYNEEDVSDWDTTLEDGLESIPYVSDDFQIGPNGAYEHTEEHEIIAIQKQLIDLLYSQVIDLSMMSKIELGDDVTEEIRRLKKLLNEMSQY